MFDWPFLRWSVMGRLVQFLVLLVGVGLPPVGWAQPADYALGPGDVVKISVFQNPDLSLEARVSERGSITYPLIGEVRVQGMSAAQVEKTIAEKLRTGGFVNRPQVSAHIVQFKSIQVSVLGQVAKPGKYALEQAKNRVSDVLAVAGGITPQGADVVTLITNEGGQERRKEVDVPALLRGSDPDKDLVVKNGDTIFVPRYPVFYIYGEVKTPGQFRLERDMTVRQAIAVGGGITLRGTERGLRVNRRDAEGKSTMRDISLNDRVLPDDTIYVKESLF
jgi:polysaccharide export outer membrane protein